jgi:hypothetical protein
MPTFVKIGRADYNLSGSTSKGYLIRLTGKKVLVQYGAINTKSRKYYWAGKKLPRVLVRKFRTIVEAERYYNRSLTMRRREEYDKLQAGKRIYRYHLI